MTTVAPGKYPPVPSAVVSRSSTNWCGSIGAFLAYYLLYYIGPGVFIVLVSGICYLGAKLLHRPVGQGVFRLIGLILLAAAASATFYSFWPHKMYTFPRGSGGVTQGSIAL